MSKNHSSIPFEDLVSGNDNPISPDDIKPIITGKTLAVGSQLFGNAIARQVLANIKFASDNDLSPDDIRQKYGMRFFTRGVSSRFLYQGVGMLPALLISDKMSEKGYGAVASSVAAASYETVVGTYMEARSGSIAFGLKNPLHATVRAVLPFTVRNFLGWLVLNTNHDSLLEKSAWGFGAGIVSAFPDSIGNRMMMKGEGCDIVGSFRTAIKGLDPKVVAKSSLVRGAAGAVSAVLLSDQVKEILAKDVFGPLVKNVRTFAKSDEVRPASTVEKPRADGVKKDSEKERG